jgi:hypothetical protein
MFARGKRASLLFQSINCGAKPKPKHNFKFKKRCKMLLNTQVLVSKPVES